MGAMTDERLRRWEWRVEWPLAVLALLFLGAYAWPILNPGIAHGWRQTCLVVDYTTWALFAVEYAVRVALATHHLQYVYRHLVDLLIIALPILRPLRLLRMFFLLRALNRRATDSLHGRIATYVVGATTLLIFCGSLAVLDAERHSRSANITSFGDAMWWAMTTITTVGYGDRYPTTTEGRWVAAGLMVAGIALLGTVTASLASWLVERIKDAEDAEDAVNADLIRELTAEVHRLRAAVESTQLAD